MATRAQTIAADIRERMKCDWPASGIFPPLRDLASEQGASPATLVASLKILVDEGLVGKTRSTGRYFVADRIRTQRESSLTEPRTLDVKIQLQTDLLQGQFSRMQSLPSVKELCHRYACGYQTIRRALESLVSQGLVRRSLRRFVPCFGQASTQRNQVWLIQPSTGLDGGGSKFAPLISAIEWELSQAGICSLRTIFSERPPAQMLARMNKVIGYLYLFDIRGSKWEWWIYLKEMAERTKIPVSIINIAEVQQFVPRMTLSRRICWMSPDNLRAGRDVGLALHRLGHRRIAFFSHVAFRGPEEYKYPTERRQFPLWARNRFLGLTEIFPLSQNASEGVRWFDVAPKSEPENPLPEDLIKQSDLLSKSWGAFRRKYGLPKPLLSQGFNPAFHLIDICKTSEKLQKVFEEALTDRRCTAWVCVNDEIAVHALTFLQRRSIRVPEDISVVGFDNSMVSYDLGLTSWEPNLSGIGHMAANFLRFPDLVKTDRLGRVWSPGKLYPRRSMGPVRR